MRLLFASLLAFLAVVFPVHAAPATSITNSVVFAFDLSFSMRLRDDGTGASRLARAKQAVREILAGASQGEENTEWALVTFEGPGSFRVVVPFTRNPSAIAAHLGELEVWNTTSLDAGIDGSLDYIESKARGAARTLVLASDCVNTDGGEFSFPDTSGLRKAKVHLVVIGSRLPDNPELLSKVLVWVHQADGSFFVPEQEREIAKAISSGVPQGPAISMAGESQSASAGTATETGARPGPESTAGVSKAQHQTTAGASSASGPVAQRSSVRFSAGWIFAFLLIVVGLLFVIAALRWFRASRLVLDYEPQRMPEISIHVESGDGSSETRVFNQLPVTVSGDRRSALYLPRPGKTGRARSWTLSLVGNRIQLTSKEMVLVNGVGTRSRTLKEHDRIAFGRYRLQFAGVSFHSEPPPEMPKPRFLLLIPVLAVILCIGFLIRTPLTIGLPFSRTPAGQPNAEADLSAVTHEQSLTTERPKEVPPETKQHRASPSTPAVAVVSKPAAIKPYVHTLMIAPGQKPAFFKADIMFLHAHPDDVSLNFGAFLAEAARAGKKIVAVVFTDGGAGLDQYPNRVVNATYPPHDLKGAALAKVRAGEAERALSILGAQEYIRLGYPNNPYNSETEVLTPAQVERTWGGERNILNKVEELLLGFRPDIVVSPEGPSREFEHFEHVTVGIIVAKALAELKKDGTYYPQGRLVCIDPLQRYLFGNKVFGIEAMDPEPGSGLTPRQIQGAALRQHITQRDASVIGLEDLPNFDKEYYQILWWDLNQSIAGYLHPPLDGIP